MTLVKWFRKNMRMLMAIFVIGILFAFIGGTQLLTLLTRQRPQDEGHFDDGQTISNLDRINAGRELEMLMRMQAPAFLQTQGLHGVLLGELLFSERQPDPAIIEGLTRMIQQGGLHATEKQFAAMFSEQGAIKPIYWILLKHEAKAAGMGMNREAAARLLAELAKQVFRGQTYQQFLDDLMRGYKLSEQQIVGIFADLLAVLQFAQLSTACGDVTLSQIQHEVSWVHEPVEGQFVKLEAQTFLPTLDPNAPLDLATHFATYRQFAAGQASPENPFGFGYRLPDRVKLDYLLVELDDVRSVVREPTQDEAEIFYQRNALSLFTRTEPTDPNDPNSPRIDVTDPFAKVEARIHRRLLTEKVIAKATAILQEARTDERLQVSQEAAADLSAEQITAHADDYGVLAKALSTKHGLALKAGRTGWLSRAEASTDARLNHWALAGRDNQSVPLTKLLFDVAPLEAEDLVLLSVPKPHRYENLGPLRDTFTRPDGDVADQTMAVVRVVDVALSEVPESLETRYDNTGVLLDPNAPRRTLTLEDRVRDDVRKMIAYQTAEAQAGAFVAAAQKQGWDSALAELNREIKEKLGQDPNGLDPVTVRKQTLRRLPLSQLDVYRSIAKQNPASATFLEEAIGESRVADELYGRIPSDLDQASDVPFAIASPSQRAIYCFNEVTVQRYNEQAFRQARGEQIQREESIASQSLAPIHFNPKNILARMGYRPVTKEKEAAADEADN